MEIEVPIWRLVGGNSDSSLVVEGWHQTDREIESNFLLYNFEFDGWGIKYLDSNKNWQTRPAGSKIPALFKDKIEKIYYKKLLTLGR